MEAAVFFDLDGTWYRKQLFLDIIKGCVVAGIMPAVVLQLAEEEYILAKQRKIPYEDFIRKQVRAYQDEQRMRNIRVSDFSHVCRRVIQSKGHEVHVFTRELAHASKSIGVRRVIVSGSPHQAVQEFALLNDIQIFLGTEHPIDENNCFTGGAPVEHALNKKKALEELSAKHALHLMSSCAIGDSRADAAMFETVGYPICFNPEKKLLTMARTNRWPVVIEEKNTIMVFRPNSKGRLLEVPLTQILPERLAQCLSERLAATGWYSP